MSKRLTQEEAINKIVECHENKYNLSEVVYSDAKSKLKLSCSEHGAFYKNLNNLTGNLKQGCPICANKSRRLNSRSSQESVISKIKEIHGDTYDLSRVEYVSAKVKITLGCKKHGWFEINPNSIFSQKAGCSQCGKERSEKAKYKPFSEVLKKCKEVHADTYDYSLIKDYKDTRTKYPILCASHGMFLQDFDCHMSGRGCPKCGREKLEASRRLSQEEAYNRCIEAHGDRYEYPNFTYVNDREKIEIICSKHGLFKQPIISHTRGSGCPSCKFENAKGVYNKTLAERNKEEWLTIPATVYYIKFTTEDDVFWKVGITTDTVGGRFKYYKIKPEIISEIETNLYDAVFIEDNIIVKNKEHKIVSNYIRGGKHECFSQPILFD